MSRDETTAQHDAEGTRGFAVVLGQLGDGDFADEIARKQRKLIDQLTTDAYYFKKDAKGSLTVEIKFSVSDDGVVEAKGSVKTKEPPPRASKATFWATKGGNLAAENPKQMKLPVRDVSAATPVRDIEIKRDIREAGQ